MAEETLAEMANKEQRLQESLQETLKTLIAMYLKGGFVEVSQFIENELPEAQRQTLGQAYLSMLREMLARVYFFDIDPTQQINETDLIFLEDAADAIGSLSRYGSPIYLRLTHYDHVEASGLQIARSPGKSTVYIGCALLIIGVFLLFYLPQRRFWTLVKSESGKTDIILSGMSNRNSREFDQFFEQIRQYLQSKERNSGGD
jgi:cytochrome c biogenesis protein